MHDLPLILIGAGGHGKVLLSLIRCLNLPLSGVCDIQLVRQELKFWRDLPVLGSDALIEDFPADQICLVNGVGKKVKDTGRREVYERFREKGFCFRTLVHPAAWVDSSACLGESVQVMAGAVIQADSIIGHNVIINTRASLDHDCKIGHNTHIAPGAILCGNVTVGEDAFIGAGAVLAQGIQIGDGALVGAGTSVVRDLAAGACLLPAGNRVRTDNRGDCC